MQKVHITYDWVKEQKKTRLTFDEIMNIVKVGGVRKG